MQRSTWFFSVKVCLEVNQDSDCKQVPDYIVTEIMVPQRIRRGSAAELQYLNPVAIIDRFIGQPRVAGKTYMKFESQELRQRIRQESSFLFQEVQLIDMHSVPFQHLIYADKSFSGMRGNSYPRHCENCNSLQYPA